MRFHDNSRYDGRQYNKYQDYSDAEEEDAYEDPKPSKEEKELLSLREKIKADIRKSLGQNTPSSAGSLSSSKNTERLPGKDRFGSFFGPSSTVIAPRVMDEIRSIKETRAIASSTPSFAHKHDASSSKPVGNVHERQPRIINEAKVKAQKLKESRDFFSSLFSDVPDPQSSTKEQSARGRPPQEQVRSKLSAPHAQRISSNGRPANVPPNSRPANVPPNSRPASAPSDGHISNTTNGYSASTSSKGRPVSKVSNGQLVGVKLHGRPVSAPSNGRLAVAPSSVRPASTLSSKRPANMLSDNQPSSAPSNHRLPSASSNGRPARPLNRRPASVPPDSRPSGTAPSGRLSKTPSYANKLTQDKIASAAVSKGKERPVSADRKFIQSSPENGSRQATYSQNTSFKAPVKTIAVNKLPVKTTSEAGLRKSTSTSKPLSSPQDRSSEQRRVVQGSSRDYSVKKQPGTLQNPQHKKPPAKRRFEDDEEDVEAAIGMIRKMFRYDPNKYAGSDEDDSDMEVGFDRIQMEERRSAKIAKKEDDEELILIQEEEQRERERLKKRRMMR